MKKLIYTTVGIFSLGLMVAVLANTSNVKTNQGIHNPLSSKKEFSTSISFDLEIPPCTRDNPTGAIFQQIAYNGGETVESYDHCKSCEIGVFMFHGDSKERTCTYCGIQEPRK